MDRKKAIISGGEIGMGRGIATVLFNLPLQAFRLAVILARERLSDQGKGLHGLRADAVQQVRMRRAAIRLAKDLGEGLEEFVSEFADAYIYRIWNNRKKHYCTKYGKGI